MTIAFWVLAVFTVLVNAASTWHAGLEVRRAQPKDRMDAALLLVRCLVLLIAAVVAALRWRDPEWLIAVSIATSAVQILDLVAALVLKQRDVILAAYAGVALAVVPLAVYGAVMEMT